MDNEPSREELEKKLSWFSKKYGPYIEKRGLGNWRNLFAKPTLSEWTILFMLLMMGFVAWAYLADTEECRETLTNLDVVCIDYCEAQSRMGQGDNTLSNFPVNFSFGNNIIKADNLSLDDGPRD